MTIDDLVVFLESVGACSAEVDRIRNAPDLQTALDATFIDSLDWLAKAINHPAWAEYEAIRDAARAECEAICAPAWAEYVAIHDPALAEYVAIRDAAWAEYKAIRAPALAEYVTIRDAARAEYKAKLKATTLDEWLRLISIAREANEERKESA